MAQVKYGSAGVSTREIDLSGPITAAPVGVPAGVIGTAPKGSAFVPISVGTITDFFAKFGDTDGKKFGPLAVSEWMRNATAVTYVRTLGVGDGKQRITDGNFAGSVNFGGFVAGSKMPDPTNDGLLSSNSFANAGGPLGRTYFLGCFMSESAGSNVFSSAGLQGPGSVTPGSTTAVPIIRGILMAASGVIIRLSSSAEGTNTAPAASYVAAEATVTGKQLGSVVLLSNQVAKQEFVLLLNGHKGTDPAFKNVLTASFDLNAPNYFGTFLNRDPYALQDAGHYLYAAWDVHPVQAVVTGSGLILAASGAGGNATARSGVESAAFLLTSSMSTANTGSAIVPNYENFQDRYRNSVSPWFVSQKVGGKPLNLFRFHAVDDGTGTSTNFKISIENLTTDPNNGYGNFTVVIRDWADRDESVKPLVGGRFNVNLNPSSNQYIAKVIGDTDAFYDFDRAEASQKLVIKGNYPNASNYVYVEMDPDVDAGNVDPTLLPMGFRGISHLVTSGSAPLGAPTTTQLTSNLYLQRAVEAPLPMRQSITRGTGPTLTVNSKLYWGVQFEHVTNVSTQNASVMPNDSLKTFARYFPDFMTNVQNVVVSNNQGVADTAQNGILDADRFCNNIFSLENIRVVTGSDAKANPDAWSSAVYVRNGNVGVDDTAKTRAVQVSDITPGNSFFLKYTTMMQGGFDGVNLFDRDSVELNNTAVTADMNDSNRGLNNGPNVRAYIKALEIMKNLSTVDVQLLAIPGIRHPIVTNSAVDAVEERFDAMYVMDIQQFDDLGDEVVDENLTSPSVQATSQQFVERGMNTSFAAAYFPDVVIPDPTLGSNVVAPPSVAVLGALALNDKLGHPWFAPAGTTRGALATVVSAFVRLSKDNMDTLYNASINPLVAFPGNANPQGGVVVWGQKTLLATASALDRVNVRRLLIEIRRQVRDVAKTIIFEPNRETTLALFSAAVTPKLQFIQSKSGVDRFKVVIDASLTTQEDIENNTIRGKIFVQPTKTTEFVSIDFAVSNSIQQ